VERRRRTRHTVEWIVEYSLGASVAWQRCRLVDLAETGATIEPFNLTDNSASGEVALRFQLPEDIAGPFAILGDIRHVTQISEGRVRLGIEFRNLSTRDVMLLNVVARSHSFA
jgi:PilZ domain